MAAHTLVAVTMTTTPAGACCLLLPHRRLQTAYAILSLAFFSGSGLGSGVLRLLFYHIPSNSSTVSFVNAQSTDGRESSARGLSGRSNHLSTLPRSRSQGDTREPPSRKYKDIFANSDNSTKVEGHLYENIFTANEIEKATDNFSHWITTGGNGEVYMGTLNGTKVVVKCPSGGADIGIHIDHILHEMEIHAKVKHPNIVQLLGYDYNLQKPCVVYEYMSKRSLFEHLHHRYVCSGLTFFTCQQRLTIAHKIGEVLVYLHNNKILHVDVKSANIMFDDNFNSKLADFGHSQIIKSGKSYISMPAEGTPALIDPYWNRTGQLTDKTDVYGFGILLVELLTEENAKDLNRDQGGEILVEKEKLMGSIDPSLKAGGTQVVLEQMKALVSLAVNCVSLDIKSRPTMKEVAEEIKRIMRF